MPEVTSYPPTAMPEVKQPISSQPYGTAPMQVGGNRNARNCPIGPDGKRDWSFGLFDCFDTCGLFCWTFWCPCVVYGKNKQRLRHLQTQGTPLPGPADRYNSDCCVYGVLGGYAWILQISNRADVRERYAIRGDTCGDCLTSWCCPACVLTQERREIELEEGSF